MEKALCPMCGGPGSPMSVLGHLCWYRCRECGIDFATGPADECDGCDCSSYGHDACDGCPHHDPSAQLEDDPAREELPPDEPGLALFSGNHFDGEA